MTRKKLDAIKLRTPNDTPEERARAALAAGCRYIARDIVLALLNELGDARMRACLAEEKLADAQADAAEYAAENSEAEFLS